MEGTLNIDLKGTEVMEEPKGWFMSLLTGKTEYEKEAVTQIQYLEKIYKIFSELGWKNIVSLDLNNETVYDDSEYKEDDFQEAINLAYSKIQEQDFKVTIHLENNTDKEESIVVDFSSKHDVGEFPLVIEADLEKSSEEITTFLTEVKNKINEVFGIESGEIVVDEDGEDEDDEDDEDDDDEDDEEETEGNAEEVKETAETETAEEKKPEEEKPVTA